MKLHLSILTGVASVAAIMSNVFADTAVTDPVGYVTVPITTANNSETFIGTPLYNKVEFAGLVTAKAANSISVGSGIAAAAFDGNYFVEITNGAGEGMWTDITGTPVGNTITTADNLSSMITVNTTTIKIRKHHTVASLFGAANEIGGFHAGAQIAEGDNLVIFDATTQTPVVIFFSTDEFDGGWRTANGTDKSSMIIAPGQGIKVVRAPAPAAAGAASFIQVGHVKIGKTVFSVETGENFISIPNATGITLDASTLGDLDLNPLNSVTAGDQIANADNVVVNTGANAFTALFYSTDEFDGGWRNAGAVAFGTQLLKEGTCVNILNLPATDPTAFNWTFPATAIAP